MPITERDVNYNPKDGEWISKALFTCMEEHALAVPREELVDFQTFVTDFTELYEPTAEEIGSPHRQECVQGQRASLCYWVCVMKRRYPIMVIPYTSGQNIRYKYVCKCSDEVQLELEAVIRRDKDGKWDVGYLKPGAEMLQ
ncbi:hypothetical protein G6O67_004514 [Ophiocordyceps sinensis]|uniref:Uncharacterized protein n=2 Tax=Ophiocordyceps sinensis TaxID=72228 RepID=A0A8H4PPK8_9HYPO|nr:hypothetical protein G6O67_004514 [Ophiocordyceps sinensis]